MKRLPFTVWLRMALLLAVMGWVLAPAAVAGQQLRMTAPFLSVAVDRGEEVKLPLTVENLSGTAQTVALSIPSVPEGWTAVVERDFPRLEVRQIYLTALDVEAEEIVNEFAEQGSEVGGLGEEVEDGVIESDAAGSDQE